METASLFTAAALLASSAMPGDMPMFQIDPGTQLCKSSTAIEGGERVLYMEASNQARDVQNETILVDALAGSKDYFLKYGRIDLDHATVWQMIREQKLDPSNPYAREIGKPLDVRTTRAIRTGGEPSILVKAGIFKSGDKGNQFTKASDWFWDSLQVVPPMAWYPSVAGTLLPGGRVDEPDGRRIIKAMRWHSIALTRNPVNTSVDKVSTVPLQEFCKALREGSDISGALSAMAGFGSQSGLPTKPLAKVPGSIQTLQNAALTPEKGEIIRQAILDAVPPYRVDEWLQTLMSANISPAEGMAFLIAILDSGHQLSISAPEKEEA
jgi:hypothetical protein